MNEKKLTHFNESGEAHMVDVHEKADTYRVAKAEGTIFVNEDAFAAISQGTAKKGDVLGIARIAGIMGAKNNASLIPLCHPIAMTKCDVDFELNEEEMKQWPFTKDSSFYIILNMGLGGNADSWAGPIDDTDLPAIMEIDWVKVSKLNK